MKPPASMSEMRTPAVPETEAVFLGQLLREPGLLLEFRSMLAGDDFYVPHHRALYGLLSSMADAGEAVDIVTVTSRVAAEKYPALFGGAAYVAGLPDIPPSTANAAHYAQQILEAAQRRAIFAAAHNLAASAVDASTPPHETADAGANELAEIGARRGARRRVWSWRDAVARAEQVRRDIVERGAAPALTSGLVELDRVLGGGFRRGELVVVGGATSMGKTGFAISVASAIGQLGAGSVLFASLEMSEVQVTNRFRSVLSGTPYTHFERDIGEAHLAIIESRAGPGAIDVEILDYPGARLRDIRAESRRLWAAGNLSAVVVDYLQIMRRDDADSREPNAIALGRITSGLKELARQLQVPILLLSQLNREFDRRQSRRGRDGIGGPWWASVELPVLADLAESGQIEKDADIVLFPVNAGKFGIDPPGQGAVVVAKQRNGPLAVVPLVWEPARMCYRSR